MSRVKSLTIRHRLVQAGRKRKCYHDQKHQIVKGDSCLEVRDGLGWKGYCLTCANAMVDSSARGLEALRADLQLKVRRSAGQLTAAKS